MKTIEQALIDEIHYPIRVSFVENKLIARGLDGDQDFSSEVATSKEFKGCVADCLYSLIEAPNFSEADTSISLSDKQLILRKVNAIYNSIGEPQMQLDEPMVYIGE